MKLDEEQLRRYILKSAQRRMALLEEIVSELNRRKYRSLDEKDPDCLRKIIPIVQELHPENTRLKVAEYAVVAVQLWRKRKGRESA